MLHRGLQLGEEARSPNKKSGEMNLTNQIKKINNKWFEKPRSGYIPAFRQSQSGCKPIFLIQTIMQSKRKNYFKLISYTLSLILATSLLSCSMVNEDLDPCAPAPNTFTKIDFIYDYNMDYVDLFKEHVGSVYLYIFDQDSIFLRRQGLRRIQMDGEVDFSMVFDTLDFKPGNTYHLVAMANGNHAGYSATLETPGFVKTDLIEGVSKISDYVIKLDRDNDGNYDFGIVNYKDAFGQPQQMIDTIWSTKPDEVRTITIPKIDYTPSPVRQPDVVVRDTIPMMRLTNSIDVNIKGSYFNETMSEDDFHVIIDFPHGNGTIDFTGTVYPAQELVYQCLRKRMRNYNEATRADGDVWGVQSIFGVSRLQVNDESSLQMYDAKTGELIVKIDNFSDYLANAFSTSQADGQELLDRNYEFQVDLTIDNNGKPLYMDITIAILGWAKRIYFYDLM